MANEIQEFSRGYEMCYFRTQLRNSKQYRAFMLTHHDFYNGKQSFMGQLVTRTLATKPISFPAEEFMQTCEPIIATSGFVNVSMDRPTCVYIGVNPDRQYRKALCSDGHHRAHSLNTGSPSLEKYINEKLMLPNGDFMNKEVYLTRAVAHQLAFDGSPSFRGIRTALAMVEDGVAHAVAISRNFAVSLHKNYKVPVLWHKTQIAGLVVGGNAYVVDELLPFAEFFRKRFDFALLPQKQLPR